MIPTGRVRWLVLGAWALLALLLLWLVVLSGTDIGSTILFVTAIALGGAAILCAGRAIDASNVSERIVWAGRALGLVGAVVAVSFPATLYQEMSMLVGQGKPLTYNIERALWYEVGKMPFVLVPALVAMRWTRMGAALFVLSGIVNVLVGVFQPFGVLYPEATRSGLIGLPVVDLLLQPAFVTAALLWIGSRRAMMRP